MSYLTLTGILSLAVCSLQWIVRADHVHKCRICRRISDTELFFEEYLVKTHCVFRYSSLGRK